MTKPLPQGPAPRVLPQPRPHGLRPSAVGGLRLPFILSGVLHVALVGAGLSFLGPGEADAPPGAPNARLASDMLESEVPPPSPPPIPPPEPRVHPAEEPVAPSPVPAELPEPDVEPDPVRDQVHPPRSDERVTDAPFQGPVSGLVRPSRDPPAPEVVPLPATPPNPPVPLPAPVEPPEPAEATADPLPGHNVPPTYPTRARELGFHGTVTLLVVVDGEGQPVSVSVQKTSGHGILDRAAVAAVEGWRFRPANRGALAPRRTRVLHFTFAPRDGLKR